MYSLNQFVGLLNTMASAHEQIKTFGEGDVWEIGASTAIQYPLMWAVPQPSSTSQKLLNMKFSILFADELDPDKSNEQDVLSDTLQMALDILAQLNAPDYADDFILDPNANLTPFTEKFDDDVAGWKADINIKINFLSDRCAVPSSLVVNPPDPLLAPVLVKNSDGSYSVSFDAGSTGVVPDSVIQNSDHSFSHNLPATESYTIPDSAITDSDGTVSNLPATTSFIAKTLTELMGSASVSVLYTDLTAAGKLSDLIQALVNSDLSDLTTAQLQFILSSLLSNQFLQDNLSATQRNSVNEIYPIQTGQTTSYATGDDGSLQRGRLTDFFTLKTNNVFGNTHRFTDENGAQVFGSHYAIDHATGLGWCTTLQTSATWATAIANSLSLTVGANTYNDFKLPNANEVLSITQYNAVCLNYAPFNLNPGSAAQVWSSTTNYATTTAALRVSYQTFPTASSVAKTASQPYLLCRKHF